MAQGQDRVTGKQINRRGLFKVGSAAAAGFLASGGIVRADATELSGATSKKRSLRVVHMTDVHLAPDRGIPGNFCTTLHQIQSLKVKPDLILNGGDSILDAYGRDASGVKAQWDAFTGLLKSECDVPSAACIGNHDIWGWDKGRSGTTGSEPLYGKNWAMDVWHLTRPYHSFNKGGWHFVVLDSCQLINGHYSPKLDGEQLEWLKSDLEATPKNMPVMVMSHMPIFSVTGLSHGYINGEDAWSFWTGLMHTDSIEIRKLFGLFPNVKLAVSGHTHLVDRVDFNGVSYCCGGSVCGAWWRGAYREAQPGFSVYDLYTDGSFDREFVVADWAKERQLAQVGTRG